MGEFGWPSGVCRTSKLPQFKPTAESEKAMNDMITALSVERILLDLKPKVDVFAENKFVYLKTPIPLSDESDIVLKMDEIMKTVPGIRGIKVVS
jgi:hypothetical protein